MSSPLRSPSKVVWLYLPITIPVYFTMSSMSSMILQYLLGFCTWYGLSTIGEPPLSSAKRYSKDVKASIDDYTSPQMSRKPMPAWLIVLFFALVAARYTLSFLVSYANILSHAHSADRLDDICVSGNIDCYDGIERRALGP